MPTETVNRASLLATPTEKPSHYRYLKEFRVEQCTQFPQHKCSFHRPFTCFHWHFPNQRRRRPIRKRDGTFNYSPDTYCTKYDETNGKCPDGDECPFLHRTAGDTERRYHLRYFKTCMCVYETDARGYCVKNGAHCAFAHGDADKRPPVYDIREIQTLEQSETVEINCGPNALDKERNLMVDDPKWSDANYVLLNYKTEQCKRPPRLCRQGYACPQYHNLRDRRRSPKKNKYRSTPCPNVKHGDEWGEPSLCEDGDDCSYCHTRTEQQFHPEIYKSSKCNDVFTSAFCPRGPFCAFAHADHEMSINRNLPTDINLAEILSTVLPTTPGQGGPNIMPLSSIVSKAGETNNNNNHNNNGDGTLILPTSLNNNTNGMDALGFFNSSSGMTDFSDVLRNSCTSPLDQNLSSAVNIVGSGNYYGSQSNMVPGGNGSLSGIAVSTFGTQSFASAVGGGGGGGTSSSDRSNSANSSTGGGGRFFDDVPKLPDSLMNGPPKGSNGGGNLPFLDNFDSILGSSSWSTGVGGDDQRDAYSLFPSSFGSIKSSSVRNDLSRGDSPSAIIANAMDKDLESDHFSGSGVTSSTSSIPGTTPFGKERFPSGSPSIGSNSFTRGPLFSSIIPDSSMDKKPDLFNLFDYPRQDNNSTLSMSPSTSNGFCTGGGGNNGPLPRLSTSTPTPIGPSSNNGFNPAALQNFMTRGDLTYQNMTALNQYLNQCKSWESQCKSWAESLNKAINASTNKENPNYSCLGCKIPDRPRTVVLYPCEHQTLCANCGRMDSIRTCPLCGHTILNRKSLNHISH